MGPLLGCATRGLTRRPAVESVRIGNRGAKPVTRLLRAGRYTTAHGLAVPAAPPHAAIGVHDVAPHLLALLGRGAALFVALAPFLVARLRAVLLAALPARIAVALAVLAHRLLARHAAAA